MSMVIIAANIKVSLTKEELGSKGVIHGSFLTLDTIRLDEETVLKTVACEKRCGFESCGIRFMASSSNGRIPLSQGVDRGSIPLEAIIVTLNEVFGPFV